MPRFVHPVHMRWSDMDSFQHVNNGAYLAYLEQARVAMFFDRYDSSFSRGTVVARHEIDYLRPIVYHPEPLRLELWVEDIRGASFQVCYEVFDGERLCARAATRLVPFDFGSDRPRRLSGAERDLLAEFADSAPTEPAPAGSSDG